MIDLGAKIQKERATKGISQKELANALGIKQNTVSQYENNKKHPSYEILILLADYFGVSTDYLLGRKDYT